METATIILPFVGAGLVGALFSRFTGMNLSMCMLCIFFVYGCHAGANVGRVIDV